MMCVWQSFDTRLRQLSVVDNTSSQYDVFIAHSSQDSLLVHQLRRHLHEAAFTTWAYDDVLPGEPIFLSICAAMCRSRRCLLLVSPAFKNSSFFHVELNDALDRQCRLGLVFCLPVYYQLDPDSRPYQLRDMPVFDYHAEDFWQKLEPAIRSNCFYHALCLSRNKSQAAAMFIHLFHRANIKTIFRWILSCSKMYVFLNPFLRRAPLPSYLSLRFRIIATISFFDTQFLHYIKVSSPTLQWFNAKFYRSLNLKTVQCNVLAVSELNFVSFTET